MKRIGMSILLWMAGTAGLIEAQLPSAIYYNPATDTWTSVPDMNAGRWYPSSTTLASGDILVTSGDDNMAVNDLPQVLQAGNNTWRDLTAARLSLPLFPRAFLASN